MGAVICVPPQTTSRFVNLNDVQELDSAKNWATCWLTVSATYWPLMASMPGFHNWLGYSVGSVFGVAAIATWAKVFRKTRKLERGLVPVPAEVFFAAIKPYVVYQQAPVEQLPWHKRMLAWTRGKRRET